MNVACESRSSSTFSMERCEYLSISSISLLSACMSRAIFIAGCWGDKVFYFLKSDLKKPFSFFFVLSVFSLVEAFSGSAVVVVAVVVVVTV